MMRTTQREGRRALAAIAASAALLAGPTAAWAATLDPYNTRPVAVTMPSPDGPGTSVQDALNEMFQIFSPSVVPDALADQRPAGMWRNASTGTPWGLTGMAFEYAANARSNTFGIWSQAPDGGIVRAQIFSGRERPGTFALLTWAGAGVEVFNPTGGGSGVVQGIDPYRFGFYTGNGTGAYNYTLDALNAGGAAEALAYNLQGTDLWALAFEDVGSTDRDYNDMVVMATALKPVPLPAAVWLLASGLVGLAGAGLRRRGAAS